MNNMPVRRLWAPVVIFLLFLAATLYVDDMISQFGSDIIGRFQFYVLRIGIWLSTAYLINRLAIILVWDRLATKAIGAAAPQLLRQVCTLLIYIIAVTGIIGIVFKRSITGFWATSGAVGLILGLALRSIILDVFTGLAVNIERPFKIGDWIMVHRPGQEQNIVGRLMEINWRTTRIETEENNTVVIPNGVLGAEFVTNFWSPGLASRFETVFCLDFSVATEQARRVLLAGVKAVLGEDGLLGYPEPQVLVHRTTPMGVEYTVRYWMTPWSPIFPSMAQEKVTTSILAHLQHAGITPAYPKQDIFHEKMPVRHLDVRSIADRKQLLARIELFEHLDDDELEIVATHMEQHTYRQGEILVEKGDKGDSMFLLVEGLLYVLLDIQGSGEETNVAQILPGQFFGEMSLLTGEPRSATIKAATDAVTYEITKDIMNALFEHRPEIAEQISKVVAERRLRNLQAQQEVPPAEKAVQAESLARHILNRIKQFFRGIFEKQPSA